MLVFKLLFLLLEDSQGMGSQSDSGKGLGTEIGYAKNYQEIPRCFQSEIRWLKRFA